MRFTLAVVIGGAVMGSLMPQMWLSERLRLAPVVVWVARGVRALMANGRSSALSAATS